MVDKLLRNKRGGLLHQVIVHIVLVGLIFALFLFATAGKINARGVRQQVLEKQTALLIDAAIPGMSFGIEKKNVNGAVQKVEIKEGKVFVMVEGLGFFKGYPYFSKYDVSVREEENKFVVEIT